MVRVALDSNILVSAAVFHGPEEQVALAGLRGRFALLIPRRVLVEAQDVLRREFPAITDAAQFVDAIASVAQLIEDEDGASALQRAAAMIRDADDVPILAALLVNPPDYFVTGDNDFLVLDGQLPFPILRARAMLAVIGGE